MGANISTFVDTVIAALLLRNPAAANLVLLQMLSVSLISLLVLLTFFKRFQRYILAAALWLNEQKIRLLFFVAVLLGTPLILIFT